MLANEALLGKQSRSFSNKQTQHL